jgi:hypothetical protein
MTEQLRQQIKDQYFGADTALQGEHCLTLHHERIPRLKLLPLY